MPVIIGKYNTPAIHQFTETHTSRKALIQIFNTASFVQFIGNSKRDWRGVAWSALFVHCPKYSFSDKILVV